MNKILFIQTNYPNFLENLFANIPVNKKSYSELKRIWAKEYFGSSNFYLSNIKRYGWKGDEIIANDINLQSAWAKEHGIISNFKISIFLKFVPQRIKNMLGLNNKIKNITFKQIEFYKPDVVYMHDITFFNKAELLKIKSMTKLLVGQIAYPMPLNKNVLHQYDLIISSFPHFVRKFRDLGIKSEYLRWCAEEKLVKEFRSTKKIYNVSYIGGFSNLHSKGNRIINKVSKSIHVNLWGYGRPDIKEAWGKDMYKIFAKSKIVINRHINISGPYANNMRMFEATSMGALLITDQKKNMSEFFDVGKEVVVYKSAEDLIEKIKYYLSHDLERNKIAKAGQKRTLKDHSYKIRMGELDKILRRYLKK